MSSVGSGLVESAIEGEGSLRSTTSKGSNLIDQESGKKTYRVLGVNYEGCKRSP
jgi:hypothetical protein